MNHADPSLPPPDVGPAPDAPPPQAPAGPARTVLVIEDHTPIRRIIAHHLQTAGYAVVEAAEGQEGLARLSEAPVDIVICDLMMPGLDGLGFMQQMRADPRWQRLPVIICSAKGSQEDVVTLVRLGANDYIVKPFSKDTLIRKVRKALGEETG